jgi:hypothetical protein
LHPQLALQLVIELQPLLTLTYLLKGRRASLLRPSLP